MYPPVWMNDRDQYLSQTQARPLGKHNIPPKTKYPSKIIQFVCFIPAVLSAMFLKTILLVLFGQIRKTNGFTGMLDKITIHVYFIICKEKSKCPKWLQIWPKWTFGTHKTKSMLTIQAIYAGKKTSGNASKMYNDPNGHLAWFLRSLYNICASCLKTIGPL